MFETIARMDLSGEDLYARHQHVAAFFSRSRSSARDYQFAVDGDMVYLRAPTPRADIDGWMGAAEWSEMPALRVGSGHRIAGVACIDATRLPARMRDNWRAPPVLRQIISTWFAASGDLTDLSAWAEPGLPMLKPGLPEQIFSPIRFGGVLGIRNDAERDAASAILRNGVGRARGFGFGCVHFKEIR